jgi:hypothetical protein
VCDVLAREQGALALEERDDLGIGVEHRLAGELRNLFGETSPVINRSVRRQAVARADDVVVMSVARRGVHRARAGIERHVIADDDERVAIDPRMPRGHALELGAFEARQCLSEAELRAQALDERLRQDERTLAGANQHVRNLGIERDGEVRGKRPRCGGPDRERRCELRERRKRAGRVRHGKCHVDRLRAMVVVLDLGFRERRATVRAPVDRLAAAVESAGRDHLR